jgi:hypothetical protein
MTPHDKIDPKGEEQGYMIDEVTNAPLLIILVPEPLYCREGMYKKRYEGTHGPRMRVNWKQLNSNRGTRGHERDIDICLPLILLSNHYQKGQIHHYDQCMETC